MAGCKGAVLLSVLASACAEPALLQVGTGEERFEPLREGDAIPMIEGAQGGWHLPVAVRARGLHARSVALEVQTAPVEWGRPRQTTWLEVDLRPAGGWYERPGIVAALSEPECHQDRDVSLRVRATDALGSTEEAVVIVVPAWSAPIGRCDR